MSKKEGLRNDVLRVVVSPAERATIEDRTNATGLSVSAYLRSVGMGFQPKAILDHKALEKLMRVHADQGRLGGLLKLWLTDRPNEGVPTVDVRDLLRQIEDAQLELRDLIQQVARRL